MPERPRSRPSSGTDFERPFDMLAHQRTRVRTACGQSGPGAFVARPQRIAERHGHVAQPAFVADAPDRAALGVAEKFFLAPREELAQLAAREPVPCVEIRQRALLRELV